MQARCGNVGSVLLIRRRQEIFVVSQCQRLWCGSCTRPLGIPLHDVASRYHRV